MNYAFYTDKGVLKANLNEKGDPLLNAIALSIAVTKGSWWKEPGFGLDRSKLKKNTPYVAQILEAALNSALAWIISAGLATSVTVEVERTGRYRIDYTVIGSKANGTEMRYKDFEEVL